MTPNQSNTKVIFLIIFIIVVTKLVTTKNYLRMIFWIVKFFLSRNQRWRHFLYDENIFFVCGFALKKIIIHGWGLYIVFLFPLLSLSFSLTHTHIHTHSHIHILTHSHTHIHKHSHTYTQTISHFLSSLSLFQTQAHFLSHFLSCSHTYCISFSISLSLSLYIYFSLYISLTHVNTNTHSHNSSHSLFSRAHVPNLSQ